MTKTFARFQTSLSDGSTATWTAEVVRVENGVAFVRHPRRAQTIPFSPVPENKLYRYDVKKLRIFEK